MPVFTAIATAVASAFAVESAIGIAAINFGVRALGTVVVSNLINRAATPSAVGGNSSSVNPAGNRVQLPPATNNKLPVVYGDAYLSPIITDAKISADQQYMWYVCAFSEVTDTGTINFDDPLRAGYPLMYWGDKQMKFDTADKTKVIALIDTSSGTPVDDTKVNDCMNVYFYSNGSSNPLYGAQNAVTVLSDQTTGGGIPTNQRWVSTDTMYKTAFAIIRIKYNQDANLTGLQQVTALTRNTLNDPGAVLMDYLKNTRYGCAVPSNLINTSAFNNLTVYSAQNITYKNNSGVYVTQPRYRINGPIDTTKDCLYNLQTITDSCDSWLQWNETLGKWSVVINCSYTQAGKTVTDLFTIYSDTVINDTDSTSVSSTYAMTVGGVDIVPVDLNNTYNKVEVQFPNKQIKDQQDFAYIDLPSQFINPNEAINKLTIQLPLVNDSVQAQYIGTRRLESSRDDLIVNLSTDYGGIQVDAGDIVRVYHRMYGWTNDLGFPYGKMFRVTQVQEVKGDDGILCARLTMTEYNDSIYGDGDITQFTPAPNTGITDPTVISAPLAPVVGNVNTTGTIPTFTVSVSAPTISLGQVTSIEFWYALSSTAPADMTGFKLYTTQVYNAGPVYPSNYSEIITVSGLPNAGSGFNYYWRARACGTKSKSGFSSMSGPLNWNPNPTTSVTGQNFQTVFSPNPVSVGLFANNDPDLSNVDIKLYGIVGAGQVDFVSANSNSSVNFTNNTWRIDSANISYDNITFSTEPIDAGNYAQWPSPSSMVANVATISVPVYYKDNTGNVNVVPPARVNVTKLSQGSAGPRGIVTLAYVPVNYSPTTASDTALTQSFCNTTGYTTPINDDGAMFYNPSDNEFSSRQYDYASSPKWKFVTLQVPGQALTSDSISAEKLRANAVTANSIVAGAITTEKITANAIIGEKIAANTITGDLIKFNTLTGDNITANTITGNKMVANTISSNLINSNAIITRHLDANSVVAEKIAAGSITADKIAANAITSDKLSANFIYTGQIQSFNANIGNANSDGFWFDSANGTGRFGNSLSVGLLIESSQLRGNVVTAENLVIGAVTQSRSTTSNPGVQLVPWTNISGTWPDNTRAIVPPNGVTLVPTSDPRSSANVEYTEGSRIEIGVTAKIYANNAPNYNCVEVWKSGASTYYSRGYNTVRHAYNLSGDPTKVQTIHAYGYGGVDMYSNDGGVSWFFTSPVIGTTTTKTITGAITYNYIRQGNYGLGTVVVGPLQNADGGTSGEPKANWGVRGNTAPTGETLQAINYYYTTFVNASNQYLYQSYNAMEVTPFTGGGGAYVPSNPTANTCSGAFVVGQTGTILFNPTYGLSPQSIIAPYQGWVQETTNTIFGLNSVYSNDVDSGKNYTAVAVGANGTILVSNRKWSVTPYTWSSRIVNKIGTTDQLLNEFYGVAGDDGKNLTSNKWVAVGKYGTICSSLDNGNSWTQRNLSTIPQNINAVRYSKSGGFWVAVGDEGVILVSSDTITWTRIQSTLTTDNLLTIDYSPQFNTFNIGGTSGIYNSTAASINSLNFVKAQNSDFYPSASYSLTRLAYWGSNPNVMDNTLPNPEQRLINGQTLSATVVDTGYAKGQPVTYFLVVGNMYGPQAIGTTGLYAGQMFINATEVKR